MKGKLRCLLRNSWEANILPLRDVCFMKPNRYGGSRFNSGPKPQPQPNSQPTPAKPFSRKLKVEDFNLDALFENFMGSVSPAPKKLEERFWFYLDRKYSGATEHLLPLAKFISPLN